MPDHATDEAADPDPFGRAVRDHHRGERDAPLFARDGPGTAQLLGVRPDPTPGLGFRVLQFEYGGTLGRPLRFRLCSPGRLREAAAATPWTVRAVRRPGESPWYYRAHLVAGRWPGDGEE